MTDHRDVEGAVEQIRQALDSALGSKAYLKPGPLLDRMAEATSLPKLTVRQAFARLAREGWIEGVSPQGDPLRVVRILGQRREKTQDPNLTRWLAAVEQVTTDADERRSLSDMGVAVSSFEDADMRQLLAGLFRLRENLEKERRRPRYLVSAEYLLGASKLLDALPSKALNAFGIDRDAFPSHPLYMMVAGPPDPEAVVLVENPAAFERAAGTRAIHRCAFVATFGFGLSKVADAHGAQLAAMVADRFTGAVALAREGSSPPAARALLGHHAIHFWGDLDTAGLGIYSRLTATLPGVRLSALYRPMIAALSDAARNHPYVQPTGKDGQYGRGAPRFGGARSERLTDLAALCSERAVDQEIVSSDEIEALCCESL